MKRRLIPAALAVMASLSPLHPARAEFFTFDELRDMCRGGADDGPQFRTRAANALLAESYRARCRMYLLGAVDGSLQNEPAQGRRCILPATPQDEVTEPIVEALLARQEAPEHGVTGIVREVLHSRFGCELDGTPPPPAD